MVTPEQASGAAAAERQIADVEQIARVRHQQKIAVAAGAEHAEASRRAAELLVAALADRAFAAAHPGMRQPPVPDLDAARLRPDRHDLADALVSHGQRQLDAAVGNA